MHQSHITGKQLLSCPFILPTPSLPQKRESTQVYHNDARVFTSILDSSLHWNDGGVPVEPRTKPLVLSLSKDAPRSCYRRAVAEPPLLDEAYLTAAAARWREPPGYEALEDFEDAAASVYAEGEAQPESTA